MFRIAQLFILLGISLLTACVALGPSYRMVCDSPPNLANRRVAILAKNESFFGGEPGAVVASYLKEAFLQNFPQVALLASVPRNRGDVDILVSFSEYSERPPNVGATIWSHTRYYSLTLELTDARTGVVMFLGFSKVVYDGGDGIYDLTGRGVCRSTSCVFRTASHEAIGSLCGGLRRRVPSLP